MMNSTRMRDNAIGHSFDKEIVGLPVMLTKISHVEKCFLAIGIVTEKFRLMNWTISMLVKLI